MQIIAENFPTPRLGIELGSPQYKTNALTTEPKMQLSEIDIILEAMRNLTYEIYRGECLARNTNQNEL